MKLGLVIASHGRPDILQQVLMNLVSQPRIPDDIVISAVEPADVPDFGHAISATCESIWKRRPHMSAKQRNSPSD